MNEEIKIAISPTALTEVKKYCGECGRKWIGKNTVMFSVILSEKNRGFLHKYFTGGRGSWRGPVFCLFHHQYTKAEAQWSPAILSSQLCYVNPTYITQKTIIFLPKSYVSREILQEVSKSFLPLNMHFASLVCVLSPMEKPKVTFQCW